MTFSRSSLLSVFVPTILPALHEIQDHKTMAEVAKVGKAIRLLCHRQNTPKAIPLSSSLNLPHLVRTP
jgi:hypothetical protein